MKPSGKTLASAILLYEISQLAAGQSFQVPQNYSLVKKADYEKDVIIRVNWLETTPVNQHREMRKEANIFLLMWVTGSPNVNIALNQKIPGFSKNPDLMMIFLGGWTKFDLEYPNQSKDKVAGNVAGIKSVIKVYQANLGKGIRKDRDVQKMIKLEKKGKIGREGEQAGKKVKGLFQIFLNNGV
jgi:hypothetical protein